MTDNVNDGYMGSGTILKRAFNKYGKTRFKKEILFECNSYEDMIYKESNLVDKDFIERSDTYNLVTGGIASKKYSKDVIERMSGKVPVLDNLGCKFKVSVDDPKYLSGELIHTSVGQTRTKATKNKIRNKAIGRKVSEATKNKISESTRGEKNHFYGKRHSAETKKLISKNTVGRTHDFTDDHRKNLSLAMVGNKNGIDSTRGTIWITHPILKKLKRIQPVDLSIFINDGWIQGRKLCLVRKN
jgi:hypothetical protein